jgi:uncharacterized hydrophobic protein (TIGR00271 family)
VRQGLARLKHLFELHEDQDADQNIDATMRKAMVMRGTNLWVLMFAILIASIGLNVNSTAVIIGAMLISPLMGPIIGVGYGLGINDFELIRASLRNLLVFVLIALCTSTLYFSVSPLGQVNSELLARTTPTIWDVLIAFCGGAAGAIALTRKEKSTVIPGVAIATALMPPLCTAGYGLAKAQPEYFVGAFYLFLINSVFISLATLLIVRILDLPQHAFVSLKAQQRARWWIGVVVSLTLLPSVYLAARLVQDEIYLSNARRFVADLNIHYPGTLTLQQQFNPRAARIELTLAGDRLSPVQQQTLQTSLAAYGLQGTQLVLRETGSRPLERPLQQDLQVKVLQEGLQAIDAKNQQIHLLEQKLARFENGQQALRQLRQEILAQYPQVETVALAQGEEGPRQGSSRSALLLVLTLSGPLLPADQQRLEAWLGARYPEQSFVTAYLLHPAEGEKP